MTDPTVSNDQSQLERAVAEFLVGFRYTDIGNDSLLVVKTLLKDQLACQLGGSQLPWSKNVRSVLRQPRPGNATVAGEATRMDAADAAYLNATYGHGFEYDDIAGNGHPGCCVVPVALAVAEQVGATLGQAVEAMVAGYEVYTRLGRIAAPDLLLRGWHPHAVLANFGAAAVAARLLALPIEQSHHALSIALSHASGTMEYTASGGSVKRVHAGMAARNGIEAAELARAGVTGPVAYLTGRKGFYRTFVGKTPSAEAAMSFRPGSPLLLDQTWFKAYCCCGAHHAYIDAMCQLRDRASEIVEIEARVQAMTASTAGSVEVVLRGPRTVEELQFSLPIQMALAALGHGNGYAVHQAFLKHELALNADSEVLQFARRIRLQPAPELDERHPRNFVGAVTARFQDGSEQAIFIEHAKGMPDNPLAAPEHLEKLHELGDHVVGAEQARRLFDVVDALDVDGSVSAITSLLIPA